MNIETNLRELKNVAILGPAHSSTYGSGATYDLAGNATHRGICVKGSEMGAGQGSTKFTNVAVSGFEYGVDLENAGLSASSLYCSSNQVGLRSNQNTYADISHGVFTGNRDGIQAQNGGKVFLERSFSAANARHGARVNGSSLTAKASSFCVNGNRGVDVEDGDFHVVSPSGLAGPGDDIRGATQYGGTTSDFLYLHETSRFDKSKRDGAFIFHNFGEGIYGTRSNIVLNSAVVSYNGKGATYANLEAKNGSVVNSQFSNFWAPGSTLHATRSNKPSPVFITNSNAEFVSSQAGEGMHGFVGTRGSSVVAENSVAIGNTFDQVHITDASLFRCEGMSMAGFSSAVNTGIRVETASTAIVEASGISGCRVGVSGGNRSIIIETISFNSITSNLQFSNVNDAVVETDTMGEFT